MVAEYIIGGLFIFGGIVLVILGVLLSAYGKGMSR